MDNAGGRVAIFIDAENLPARIAGRIIEIASRYGRIVGRNAYGDFTREAMRPWVEAAPAHALSLQTVCTALPGKNSSDILLAIDVVEFLYRSEADIFCIASSDSDFTHLASRLRMRGKQAIGIGSPKACKTLRDAFDEFFELEIKVATQAHSSKVVSLKQPAAIRPYILDALNSLQHNRDEWLDIARLGSAIRALHPGFSPKEFGSAKFSTVLKNCHFLETQMHGTNRMQIRVRAQ